MSNLMVKSALFKAKKKPTFKVNYHPNSIGNHHFELFYTINISKSSKTKEVVVDLGLLFQSVHATFNYVYLDRKVFKYSKRSYTQARL